MPFTVPRKPISPIRSFPRRINNHQRETMSTSTPSRLPPPPQSNKWSKISNLFAPSCYYHLYALFFIAFVLFHRPSLYCHVTPRVVDVFRQEVPEISDELFHFPEEFKMDYMQMEKDFKIFMYPVEETDTFCYKLFGKYATEGYFLKNLQESRFLTNDPNKAHLFFVPIPCHSWQGQAKSIAIAIEDQVQKVISEHPYWNRTSGGDHFFVMCHDIPTINVRRFMHLTKNSIRVVCSSNYFVEEYMPHKDVSLPKVTKPAMLEAAVNSTKNRQSMLLWHFHEEQLDLKNNRKTGPLKHQKDFYESRYCFGPSSYAYRTLHYGCVPALKTRHYDLPFNDIIDWQKFSVIIFEQTMGEQLNLLVRSDVDHRAEHYIPLHNNTVKVRKHFQWNSPPVRLDAFHLVLYELWQRRHVIKYSSIDQASLWRHMPHRRKELFHFMVDF